MAEFNPIQSFQRGQQNALALQSQRQGVARETAAAPVRNQLAQLGLEQKQTAQAQQTTEFGQTQEVQKATILNQTAKALAQLPLEQRDAAMQRLGPRLQQFGIQPGQLQAGGLSDDILSQVVAGTQPFLAKQPTTEKGFTLKPGETRFGPTGSEIANIPGQVDDTKERSLNLRTQQLAFDKEKEQRQSTKMSAGLEKSLLGAQHSVVQAQRNSAEFDILAQQVEDAELTGGVASSTSETFKALLGSQDDVTEMRRRFNSVRLSEGLKNLPPGPATDKDMEQAFKGVPREDAPASQIASFLRGAAKMARFDAGYNQFKADFISKNSTAKGLNKEWRKTVRSTILDRTITIAEIYAEAAAEGITPEEVKAELGIE